MKSSLLFTGIICMLVLAGCNQLSSDDEWVKLQTNQDVYAIDDTVTVSVTNYRSSSIFLYVACDLESKHETISVEFRSSETWKELPPPQGCHPVGEPWIEIRPGKSHSIRSAFSEPGEYRYRLGLYSSISTMHLLTTTERTSNMFIITEK